MTLPMATLTGQAAIDEARSRVGGSMAASGYCLQLVRECFRIPAVYGSAIDAAYACHTPQTDRDPQPGTPVWFWTSSIYEHVAFYVGPHEVISTFNADIRTFDGIAGIESAFAGRYAGHGWDLNEHQVHVPATVPVPPPPPEEDEDMVWFIRRNDGAIVIVGPTGVRTVTAVQWDVYGNLGWHTKLPPEVSNMDPGPFAEIVESLGGIVE